MITRVANTRREPTYTVGAAGDGSAPLFQVAREQLQRRRVAALHLDAAPAVVHNQPIRRLQLQNVWPRHIVERWQERGALGRDRRHSRVGPSRRKGELQVTEVGPALWRRRGLGFECAKDVGAKLGSVIGRKRDAGAGQRKGKSRRRRVPCTARYTRLANLPRLWSVNADKKRRKIRREL